MIKRKARMKIKKQVNKKISSYQKLKKENEELYHLYKRARKSLNELGEGISGDDLIMDFDSEMCSLGRE